MAKLNPRYTLTLSLEEVLRHNTLEDRDKAQDLVVIYNCICCPACGKTVAPADGSKGSEIIITETHFCTSCGQRLSGRTEDGKDYIPLEEL